MVWQMRQNIRLYETRAIVQSILAAAAATDAADKEMQKSWQDYNDELYPSKKGAVKNQDQKAIDFLKNEVAKGALSIRPLKPLGRSGSKLQTKAQAELERKKKYTIKPPRVLR